MVLAALAISSASIVWMRFMAPGPSSVAARQRQVGPEHRYDAPKGPACATVCRSPPVDSARRRSSHDPPIAALRGRSEEHTSELQSLMRISYAVFCLKKKKYQHNHITLCVIMIVIY